MAGGADRRGAGARSRHPGDLIFPCELFCRLQGARHHGADHGPRPALGVARGCCGMTRAVYLGICLFCVVLLKLRAPDGSNVKFDLANFSWIGTPLQEPQVTWVWHTAPAASVEDLKSNTILMGATTASADNAILPMLVDELIGTKMKVLTGYQ